MGAAIAIRLLGPMEVCLAGCAVPAGGPTQRAVLAMLALHAGQPLPADALLAGLWGESDEPLGGSKAIQIHVSRLRHLLQASGAQPVATVPGGYRLDPAAVEVDAVVFERLLQHGQQQLAGGQAAASAATLERALALWRGPALMDLRDLPFAGTAADRYDELRIDADEELCEARLRQGEAETLLPRLHALVAEHPYRERLHGQLMLALYRAGQQAAALDAYTAARSRLAFDLGVEPGPELQRLQQQILDQAPGLTTPSALSVGGRAVERPGFAPQRLPRAPILLARDAELDALCAKAGEHRLITLTGAGGCGKTALAIALLHRLAPDYQAAAFVDLGRIGAGEQLLPALAEALGLGQGSGGLAERMAYLLGLWRTVVVLDNVEHLLDAVADLAPVVEATRGLFIATSRAPLGLKDEHLVVVDPLPVPQPNAANLADEPAVRLFLRAATAAGGEPAFDDVGLRSVARICRLVDGLPLGIEIVAAHTRTESVVELADSLSERLPVLAGVRRDAPVRQRTMEAAIDWSLGLAGPDARAAFARLAVFPGAFDARGAVAVLGRDRPATIGLLADLLNVSLLVRQPTAAGQARFRMLEPMRAVARKESSESERRESATRHAEFVLAEIDRLCPTGIGVRQPEDLAQLRLTHADLLAALGHLAETSPDRCIDAVIQLYDYWQWTGTQLNGQQVVRRVLDGDRLSRRARCDALNLKALFDLRLADPEGAVAWTQALAMSGGLPPGTRARIHHLESWYALFLDDPDRGKRACRDALAFARRSGDRYLINRALLMTVRHQAFGTRTMSRRRVERLAAEALKLAEAEPMPSNKVYLMGAVAHLAVMFDGDYHSAYRAYRSGMDIATQFDSPDQASFAATGLANLAVRIGKVDEGRSIALTSLVHVARSGLRMEGIHHLNSLAFADAAGGRAESAVVIASAVRALAPQMSLHWLDWNDEAVDDAIHGAIEQLGPDAASRARARGEAMDYREAVLYAFESHGITPS